MPEPEIIHDTFAIEKSFSASPTKAFAAFADPQKKRRWYGESNAFETLEHRLDFSIGGQEVLTGRMLPTSPITGALLKWTSAYAEIMPDNRIVFSQVVDMNGRRISCSLVTVEFFADAGGTRLRLTHQAAFFEGSDGPAIRKAGWEGLLTRLGEEISRQ